MAASGPMPPGRTGERDGGAIVVADPDDPRVEPYRCVRERDLAGRSGLFVAEGEVVVRLLLSPRSRFRAHSLLLAKGIGPKAGRVAALVALARTADPGLPVFLAAPAVMDRIAGFPVHRGVLALGRRGMPADVGEILPPPGPALVAAAIGLANHDNVGALFRNAAAFGVSAVLIGRESCDPLYRKAIRVSAGTALTLPFGRAGGPGEVLAALTRAGFEPFGLSPTGAERLEDVIWPARTAILVGSEGHGLPAEVTAGLRTIRIAMAPGIDSLNVATAAAIALHAASRRRD